MTALHHIDAQLDPARLAGAAGRDGSRKSPAINTSGELLSSLSYSRRPAGRQAGHSAAGTLHLASARCGRCIRHTFRCISIDYLMHSAARAHRAFVKMLILLAATPRRLNRAAHFTCRRAPTCAPA